LIRTSAADSIELKVGIGQTVNKRTFTGIPLSVIGLSPDLVVEQALPEGTVTVQADSEELGRMVGSQIRLLIDASQIRTAGTYSLKTICDSPPRSLVLSVDPAIINLTVGQSATDRPRP
jgi:hypothetical protein